MKFCVVIEETGTGYSAYSPDLPGCVSTGHTRAEVERNMHEAIEFHIKGLQLAGYPVPEPSIKTGVLTMSLAVLNLL